MLFERIKLEADEKIVQVVRKHWWIIFLQSFGIVLLAILPVTVLGVILGIEPGGQYLDYTQIRSYLEGYGAEITFLYLAWLLLLWILNSNNWTDYYLDLWAITDRRVVLVDQRGFFRRYISSFRLERLQDMNIEVEGVIPTLLDFGTIEAQTAGGSNEEFISQNMPKPRDIKATIVRCADELTATQSARIETMKQQGI